MNKASHFSAPPLRAVPPVNDTRLSQCVFSAIARKKLPFQGAFFMRYCFRTKRLQQKRGWRDGRNFPHHTATVARVRASLAWLRIRDNTRWGWGAGRRAPSALATTVWRPQIVSVAAKEARGIDSRGEGFSFSPDTTQAVSFRRATIPRRASSATTFSAKTGSIASASGERPTCMVRQSKGWRPKARHCGRHPASSQTCKV